MTILILGAGIIGLTTACVLAGRGHQVRVLEREHLPGQVSSYMNGGQFSFTYAEPLASPSMLRQLPVLLLRRQGALTFNRRALPDILPWGLRFLRNCNSSAFTANTRTVLQLARLSREEMGNRLNGSATEFDFRETGKLHLYRDSEIWQATSRLVALKNDLGFRQERWDTQQCLAAEPALADYGGSLAGGIFSPLDQSGDSYKLIQHLAQVCQRSGDCEILTGFDVKGFLVQQSRFTGVRTTQGDLYANACVVCAGAESPRLLRELGLRLPILPVKGYSITVPALPGAPELNLTDTHHKIVFTRLGERLRVAGLMDFAGWDRALDRNRIEHLLKLAESVLPKAGAYHRLESSWTGLRPMTPDGVPIISPTRWDDLWLNIGHGMLGSTLAFGSARLIADLVDGKAPTLASSPYHVDRFA